MNLQQQEQFYQFMNRVKANSRAASTEDKRITEVVNGIITTRPIKKIEYLNTEPSTKESEQGPEIIELTKSKAGSVQVNKLREIHDFMNRRRY